MNYYLLNISDIRYNNEKNEKFKFKLKIFN